MGDGLRQAEYGLRLARRLDRGGQRLGGAARLCPVWREFGRRGGRGTRQFPGEAGVQRLALAGQDRRVDGFGQQRVAKPEGARGLVGDEDLVLDGLAQRPPHVGLGDRGEGAEQRVADVAPGGGRQPQQALRRGVEPFHPLQQQVAYAAREFGGPARAGREELLGEEGVASGAGDDRVGELGSKPRARRGGEQRRQVLGRERAEVEHEAGTRAPYAVGQPGHAPLRGWLVPAISGEQHHRSFGQVVGEEDDQVEG